jgi:putative redox protein
LGSNPFHLARLPRSNEVSSMKAVVESIGKVGSRVRVGGHELVFDQPGSVPGGEDRGPSPLDVMVASVGACAHYFAAAYLQGRGLAVEGLTVEVEGEKARVPVSRIGRLVMRIKLPGGLSDKHIAGIERAIKSCPAYGTLLHSPSVDIEIESDIDRPTMQAQSA